jgi:hypothetical protein
MQNGLGRTPPWAATLFSYIYVGHAPLLHTLSSFHPLPCCSTLWLLLKRSVAEIVSHQHLEKWRRRSSGGSLLPLPRWTEGMEDVTESYVWPSTEAPLVVAPCTRSWDRRVNDYVDYVKWTTLSTTSSEQLHRLRASLSSLYRQCLCGNVILASGLRGLVNRCFHLVDDLG